MSEQFSILIDSHSRFETGAPGGAWLPMPATQEQLHAAMRSVGITADNPQDFFVGGFANTEDCPFDVPLAVIQSGSMDELNYLGKLLEMQRDEDKAKFAAAVTLGEYAGNLKDLINLAQNLDCYWLYPTVQSEEDYGYYLIDELDELELPEEAKKYFMYEEYGRDAAINDGGRFTEQGYVYNNKNTFSEWYNGRDIPKEYRIMSYPQPAHLDPEKVEMDAIGTRQAATLTVEPPQPQPVIPINLTAEKPAEKLKEITDRLEQGITELFDSERYKEYLRVMSKFHNYSFNNTLLIAMQKPEMAPTKSNDRILPITEEALPYFLRQFDLIARQKALTEAGGGVYYDNKLFIAKPDGSPQRRDRMSANFGQLIRHLEMPHIRFHDLRHTAATNMHQLTGDFYTVGEILGHTLKGIGISLGISTNLEAVTAQYVDVRLERKQSVLQTYHKALQPKTTVTGKEAGQETSKKAKKKSSEMEL